MNLKKNNKAFTLIELLVVISIIGLLSAMSVYAVSVARVKARDSRRASDIKQIQTAIELYYDNHSYYPGYLTLQNCSVDSYNALGALVSDGIMSAVPVDPLYKNTNPFRQCYNYLGLGNTQSYASESGLYCDGRRRTDFQWTLLFSTESSTFDFPTDSSNNYTYCVHGDLI